MSNRFENRLDFIGGLAFCVFGIGFLYILGIQPTMSVLAALRWVETPCIIVSSQVGEDEEHPIETFYFVHVVYRYSFGGRQLTSDRYQFFSAGLPSRKRKEAIVLRYPAGTETTCFVDPNHPERAVIKRGFTLEALLALLPLLFLGSGIGTLVRFRRNRREKSDPDVSTAESGPVN